MSSAMFDPAIRATPMDPTIERAAVTSSSGVPASNSSSIDTAISGGRGPSVAPAAVAEIVEPMARARTAIWTCCAHGSYSASSAVNVAWIRRPPAGAWSSGPTFPGVTSHEYRAGHPAAPADPRTLAGTAARARDGRPTGRRRTASSATPTSRTRRSRCPRSRRPSRRRSSARSRSTGRDRSR